jgi:hypothetical protein
MRPGEVEEGRRIRGLIPAVKKRGKMFELIGSKCG